VAQAFGEVVTDAAETEDQDVFAFLHDHPKLYCSSPARKRGSPAATGSSLPLGVFETTSVDFRYRRCESFTSGYSRQSANQPAIFAF
jgi:hypothetical protein